MFSRTLGAESVLQTVELCATVTVLLTYSGKLLSDESQQYSKYYSVANGFVIFCVCE
jgi:hypothetical protein